MYLKLSLFLTQDLRVALGEKEQLLKEVEKERELWRQRDGALTAVLQEKEALIRTFKEQLEKGMEVIHLQPNKPLWSFSFYCPVAVKHEIYKCFYTALTEAGQKNP